MRRVYLNMGDLIFQMFDFLKCLGDASLDTNATSVQWWIQKYQEIHVYAS